MSDYRIVKGASVYVKGWKRRQAAVGEESITDWLLDEIDQHATRFRYKLFNKDEEAKKTGADWEWWILVLGGAYRFRVQAKNTWANTNHRQGLEKANKHGRQVDKLLADARRAKALALYAFYTGQSLSNACPRRITDEGAYLAGARQVFDSFLNGTPGSISDQDLLDLSVPLSCLIGCPLLIMSKGNLGSFIQSKFTKGLMRVSSTNEEDEVTGFHEELPGYVNAFLRQTDNEIEVEDWWERAFAEQIADFNALAVFDARESE